MNTIDQLLHQALAGKLERNAVKDYCNSTGESPAEVWNSLALTIARRFMENLMTFDKADFAINRLNSLMVADTADRGNGTMIPEPADSIYLAFDAGEYIHEDGGNPVDNHTRPQLANILKSA